MALASSPLISIEHQASVRTPEDVAEQTLKTMQLSMDSKAKEDQVFTARLVKARYAMIDRIGSGGFGSIFKAYDTELHMDVAIKVEKRQGKCYLSKEVLFYATLERYRRPNEMRAAPRCHYAGEEAGFKIAVFDLMGESLSDLFYRCGRRFSLKCVLMLAQQVISRLESVHEAGIVHRDVKPGNFVMGRGADAGKVFVIDFGLSNLWRNAGKHISFNTESPFRGTHRYASVNSHNKFEQSRRDDLEAVAYVLVYFCKGGLPWQSLKVSRSKRRKAIGKFKASISPETLCAGLPIQFTEFLIYVKSLAFDQTPDYAYCRALFRTAFENHMFEDDGVWDWDLLPAVQPQSQATPTHQAQATPPHQVRQVQQQQSMNTEAIGATHRRTHPDLKQPSQPMTHQQAQALHHHQYQHQQSHNPGSGPHPGPRMHPHFVATPQSLTAASQLQAAHQRQRQHQSVSHVHNGQQSSNGGRITLQQQQHTPHLMNSVLPITLAAASPSNIAISSASGGRMRANDTNTGTPATVLRGGTSTSHDFQLSGSSSSTSTLAADSSSSSTPTVSLASLPPTHVKLMVDTMCAMPNNPSARPNVNLLPQARINIGNGFPSSSKASAQQQQQQLPQQARNTPFFQQLPQHHQVSSPQQQPHEMQHQLTHQRHQPQQQSQQIQPQPLWSFLASDRATSPVLGAVSIAESSSASCVISNGSSTNALSTSGGLTITSPASASASTVLSSSSSTIPRSPTASPHPQQYHSSNIIDVDSEDVFGNANSNSSLLSSSNTISFATVGTSTSANGGGGSSSSSVSANNSATSLVNGQSEVSFSSPSSNPESPIPCLSTPHSMIWTTADLLAESPFCHTSSTLSFGTYNLSNNSANNTSTDSAPSSEGGLFVRNGSGSTSPSRKQLKGAAKKRARATAGSNPLPDPILNMRRSARLQNRSNDSSHM